MQGASEVPKDKLAQIQRGYKVLEKYLSETTFLASNSMTLADLTVFAWMESITQVASVEDFPKITTWLNELRKLPYYGEANKDGADLHIKLFKDALERNRKA